MFKKLALLSVSALGLSFMCACRSMEANSDLPFGKSKAIAAETYNRKNCSKLPLEEDAIFRLSKIEVYPQYLKEYMQHVSDVGRVSIQTEAGVIAMYALADKKNPSSITILEIYSSREAYAKHIASEHFKKYKSATLHMVKSLVLDDQVPVNPANRVFNYLQE